MTNQDAVKQLESVIADAIQDTLEQDHAETPYVKALSLKSLSTADIIAVAKLAAKEIVKRCEAEAPKPPVKKDEKLKADEFKI